MLFSSPRFFVFLLLLLIALAIPRSVDRKKHVLALASCLFYAAWDYRYLGLLLLISVIDYWCAARIFASTQARARKRYLWLSIASNLAILGYFKYFNFFLDNLNGLLPAAAKIHALTILLPAGISFYTFKSMSYTIDVYRNEIKPCRSHIDYTTFITFFPELIAGPIVRASVLLPQMDRQVGLTRERLAQGASLFLLGISKKVLIADHMSVISDSAFNDPGTYSPLTLWCGVLAYGIQIYADFSGYSDMAIGTAKLIGYDLPENFNMPYLSRNITEFWRRWHITLSSWLRDYLYVPLGGNRQGPARTYLNLGLTMLLGGLWHGASWNFVFWGALHGTALAGHRFLTRGRNRPPLPVWLAMPGTLFFVLMCWIPFRSTSLTATGTMLQRMFSPGIGGAVWLPELLLWGVGLMVLFHLMGIHLARVASQPDATSPLLKLVGARLDRDPISGWSARLGMGSVLGAFLVTTWVLIVFYFGAVSVSPFIYFQF